MKLKNITITALIFITLALLAGCSTSPGKSLVRKGADLTDYNPQNYQGCSVVEYVAEEATLRWWDCKDKGNVIVGIDMNSDGVVDANYSAGDVRGSDAAAIRAGVEKAFAEAGVEIVPDVVEKIVKGIKGP